MAAQGLTSWLRARYRTLLPGSGTPAGAHAVACAGPPPSVAALAYCLRSRGHLTFGAVTVRLLAVPLFFVTQDPVVATTLTFWSWVLNLVVAEWLVRRH